MKLDPLVKGMKLYCRRLINIGGRNYLPGEAFPYAKLSLSWRMILRLYEHRRVISENDPYFQELMETNGLINNSEFAKAWLKENGVDKPKKEPPPEKPKKSTRTSGPVKREKAEAAAKKKADAKAEAERKKAGDLAAGIDPGDDDEESLDKKTVPELKEMAKELEISGYSSMKKADLIEAIEAAE